MYTFCCIKERQPRSFDEAFTLPSSSLGTSWLLSAQKLKEWEQPAGSALAKDVPSSPLMNPIRLPHPLSNPAERGSEVATFCKSDYYCVLHTIYWSSRLTHKVEPLQFGKNTQ